MTNKYLLDREKYEKWVLNAPKDVCLLCEYNENQVVIEEYDNWVWVFVLSPYWKMHTMVIPRRHVTDFVELSENELMEMQKLVESISNSYPKLTSLDEYSELPKNLLFFWRKRYLLEDDRNNPSNLHLHIHISPDRDHSWEPILDSKAHEIDILKAAEILRSNNSK